MVWFILNLKLLTRVNYSILSEIIILKVEDSAKQLRLNNVLMYCTSLLLGTLINIADVHSDRTRGIS